MTNNISDREPVPIDKYEVAHTALRQLNRRVSAARTQANDEYRLVAKNSCFENAGTTRRKGWLNIDESNVNWCAIAVDVSPSQCAMNFAVWSDEP